MYVTLVNLSCLLLVRLAASGPAWTPWSRCNGFDISASQTHPQVIDLRFGIYDVWRDRPNAGIKMSNTSNIPMFNEIFPKQLNPLTDSFSP